MSKRYYYILNDTNRYLWFEREIVEDANSGIGTYGTEAMPPNKYVKLLRSGFGYSRTQNLKNYGIFKIFNSKREVDEYLERKFAKNQISRFELMDI